MQKKRMFAVVLLAAGLSFSILGAQPAHAAIKKTTTESTCKYAGLMCVTLKTTYDYLGGCFILSCWRITNTASARSLVVDGEFFAVSERHFQGASLYEEKKCSWGVGLPGATQCSLTWTYNVALSPIGPCQPIEVDLRGDAFSLFLPNSGYLIRTQESKFDEMNICPFGGITGVSG
jgi:hypothetical protein